MSNDVLVVAEHAGGKLTDVTFELLGKARSLAAQTQGRAVVALFGGEEMAAQLGAADSVINISGPSVDNYTAEAFESVLVEQITSRQPKIVLLSTATQGLDLAGALSVLCNAPLASYVTDIEIEDGSVVATSQIYGGKIMAEVVLDGATTICAVSAGSFPADAGRSESSPSVEELMVGAGDGRMSFRQFNEPESGDVDITAAELLVAIGRGIGSQDDLDIVEEFAEAIGASVAASRPVTDAGWLPKDRQVGKSGLTVKPRAYLMFGISGAPEHLEGMRDAELIIACNTDEKAPIFDVAHYGTTVDLFDLLPALTEQAEA